MASGVIPFPGTAGQNAKWTLLQLAAPGAQPETIGVFLLDLRSGQHWLRFRQDLSEAFAEEADIAEALEEDLRIKAAELGGQQLFEWLEENASGFLQISEPETAAVADFERTLNRLYSREVHPQLLPFRTHLPVYGFAAAAGRWGPERNVEAEPERWVEMPPSLRRLRLTEDLFVARVTGASMEPLIPADSLCVFRGGAALAGSRKGKRVLVVNYGDTGDQRFTVKRYESVRRQVDEDRTETVQVILHPLNSAYEAWELDYEPFTLESSGRIRVVGEFVAVLPEDEEES